MTNKIPLIITVITSLICSRTMFLMFNDPEGPNLLIVTVATAVIYFVSLALYSFARSSRSTSHHFPLTKPTNHKEILTIICIQMALAVIFYFLLR